MRKCGECPFNSNERIGDQMKTYISFGIAVAMATTAAFAESAQSEKVEQIENAPVNCDTAEQDLAVLARERKDAEGKKVVSLTALSPGGAVLGIVTGTEDKKLEMLSGDYIKKIDAKTAEIKSTCNL